MKKLLLPVDGSSCSVKTLEWAAQSLGKQDKVYYLLYVIPSSAVDSRAYATTAAEEVLDEARTVLENAGQKVERTEVMTGNPAEDICQYAMEHELDEVLIGSHGRSGLAKILMGSVSQHVLEHCPKPVFVYRNIER